MSDIEIAGGPLNRFLQLLGFEQDMVRSKAEALRQVNNPALCPGDLLPLLAGELGLQYESNLGMAQNRELIAGLVGAYKEKGSINGIIDLVMSLTGWGASVAIGPNIVNTTHNIPICVPTSSTLSANQVMRQLLTGGNGSYYVFGPTFPMSWYLNGYKAIPLSYADQIESYSGAPVPATITFATANSTVWTNGSPNYVLDFNSAISPNTHLVDAINYGIPIPSGATVLSSSLLVMIYPVSSMSPHFSFFLDFYESDGTFISSSSTDTHSYSPTGNFDIYKVQDITIPSNSVWFGMHLQVKDATSDTNLSTNGEIGLILAAPMANTGTTVATYVPPREIQITLEGDRVNLVANPSFEGNSTTGWTGTNCTLAASTAAHYVGGVVPSGATTSWTLTMQPPVNPGPFKVTVPAGTTTLLDATATASAIASAISSISGFSGTVSGTGGPINTAPVVLTFSASQSTMTVAQVGQNLATNAYSLKVTASSAGNMSVTSGLMTLSDAAEWVSGSGYSYTPTTARQVSATLTFYESDGSTELGTVSGLSVLETVGNWVRPFACTEQQTTATFPEGTSFPQPAGTTLGGSITPAWANYISSTAKVNITFTWDSVANAEIHYLDAVMVEISDTPGMYFDGSYYDELNTWDVSDYQWAGGTANTGPSYYYRDYYAKFNRLDQVLAGVDPSTGEFLYGSNPNLVAPNAPTLTAGTTYNGAVSLEIAFPTSDGGAPFLGWNLYIGVTTGDEDYTTPVNGANLITQGPYVVTGLANATEYFFKAKAVTAYGESAASSEVNMTPSSGDATPTSFIGPGYIVTVWEIPGEYNNPTIGAASGLVIYSGREFWSGSGPIGILVLASTFVPSGVPVNNV